MNNAVIVPGGQQKDSAIYTCIHSPPNSPFHPGCRITWSRAPCGYRRTLMVTHFKYSSVYIMVSNSLSLPSDHSSPLATVSSFSVHLYHSFVHLYKVHLYRFLNIPQIRDVMHYFPFSVWLSSLSISRSLGPSMLWQTAWFVLCHPWVILMVILERAAISVWANNIE